MICQLSIDSVNRGWIVSKVKGQWLHLSPVVTFSFRRVWAHLCLFNPTSAGIICIHNSKAKSWISISLFTILKKDGKLRNSHSNINHCYVINTNNSELIMSGSQITNDCFCKQPAASPRLKLRHFNANTRAIMSKFESKAKKLPNNSCDIWSKLSSNPSQYSGLQLWVS